MNLDPFERAMTETPEEGTPMRANRRLPLPDLMLAQLNRRLSLAAQAEEPAHAENIAVEILARLAVVGVVGLCAVLLWVWWG